MACGAVHSICDSNGGWLDSDTARQYYEEEWEILENATDKSHQEAQSLPDSAKMMDFFRQEVEKRRFHAKQPDSYRALMVQIVERWGAFMGSECETQGLKNVWPDAGFGEKYGGSFVFSLKNYIRLKVSPDNLFMASTYKDIVNDLWLHVSEHVALRLGCEVTAVVNSGTGGLYVEAADGFRGMFDELNITAPLGWLKRNEGVFSPPLSSRISTAIRSLGYGNLDRVFIKFPEAFWNAQVSDANGFHGREPPVIQELGFPIDSLFLRPEYAADTNPANWRQEIISFSGLPEPFCQPGIMFFVYGQWGRNVTGLVRGMAQDSPEYHKILDDTFRPYYSKLPNYDPDSPKCKPVAFMSTDWQDDKYAGFGSFTNLPTGSGDCLEHFQALREGMGEDRGIWFAGEHTSPPGGLGTVTGAYWSGEEAAKRVGSGYNVTIDV
ncbi:MAG: hypothetical protein Q9207_007949 [Kuettlingeria erythrocarpa]